MGRLLTATLLLSAVLLTRPVQALQNDFDVSLDVRAVTSDGQTSYLNGGAGKLRFDPQHDGLRLGSLRLGYRGDLTDTVRLTVESMAYGDHDVHPIDLTELYVAWRPVPQSSWRSELKAGAFYPSISLEHRMRGWRTPYSLSASAVNTWIGEELRTIGVEYDLDLLHQPAGGAWNFGFNVAAFGWNDTAGIVLAKRGWSLHDRQTTLFGKVGQPHQGLVDGRTLFYRDLDRRPGYYSGLSANYRGKLELRALHYDNLTDPYAYAPAISDGGWHTVFESVGARWTPDDSWTVIWQRLSGVTSIIGGGGKPPENHWHFDSSFLLTSWQRGAHRLTARYDDFDMRQDVSNFFFYFNDRGHALTAAYLYTLNPHVTLVGEWLQIRSDLAGRRLVGAPVSANEHQLQLALRLEL